jgi:UDP-2,3-diacylglucosamine pyrophosphatase LpxH
MKIPFNPVSTPAPGARSGPIIISQTLNTAREPIRIISDLHLGYSGSLLTDVAQLRPLLDGVGTVVFNGDTAELRTEPRSPAGRRELVKLQELCAQAGVEAVFVNGNHDPAISKVNHVDLAEGAILVTHGDMLFTDLAPWCKEARKIGNAHRQLLNAMDDDLFEDFEARLRLVKDAIISVGLPELHLHSGPLARLVMFAREAWPPTRPFTILRCWRESPRRAAAMARVFRPRARFILIGHFHNAGITRLDPRVIVNTGSFTPLLGCLAVDIAGGELSVKRINRIRGVFSPGKEIARFPISALPPDES